MLKPTRAPGKGARKSPPKARRKRTPPKARQQARPRQRIATRRSQIHGEPLQLAPQTSLTQNRRPTNALPSPSSSEYFSEATSSSGTIEAFGDDAMASKEIKRQIDDNTTALGMINMDCVLRLPSAPPVNPYYGCLNFQAKHSVEDLRRLYLFQDVQSLGVGARSVQWNDWIAQEPMAQARPTRTTNALLYQEPMDYTPSHGLPADVARATNDYSMTTLPQASLAESESQNTQLLAYGEAQQPFFASSSQQSFYRPRRLGGNVSTVGYVEEPGAVYNGRPDPSHWGDEMDLR